MRLNPFKKKPIKVCGKTADQWFLDEIICHLDRNIQPKKDEKMNPEEETKQTTIQEKIKKEKLRLEHVQDLVGHSKRKLETLEVELAEQNKSKQLERFKPDIGESYYFINNCGEVCNSVWRADILHLHFIHFDAFNVFRTRREAELEHIRTTTRRHLQWISKRDGWKANFKNIALVAAAYLIAKAI